MTQVENKVDQLQRLVVFLLGQGYDIEELLADNRYVDVLNPHRRKLEELKHSYTSAGNGPSVGNATSVGNDASANAIASSAAASADSANTATSSRTDNLTNVSLADNNDSSAASEPNLNTTDSNPKGFEHLKNPEYQPRYELSKQESKDAPAKPIKLATPSALETNGFRKINSFDKLSDVKQHPNFKSFKADAIDVTIPNSPELLPTIKDEFDSNLNSLSQSPSSYSIFSNESELELNLNLIDSNEINDRLNENMPHHHYNLKFKYQTQPNDHEDDLDLNDYLTFSTSTHDSNRHAKSRQPTSDPHSRHDNSAGKSRSSFVSDFPSKKIKLEPVDDHDFFDEVINV